VLVPGNLEGKKGRHKEGVTAREVKQREGGAECEREKCEGTDRVCHLWSVERGIGEGRGGGSHSGCGEEVIGNVYRMKGTPLRLASR